MAREQIRALMEARSSSSVAGAYALVIPKHRAIRKYGRGNGRLINPSAPNCVVVGVAVDVDHRVERTAPADDIALRDEGRAPVHPFSSFDT